MIGAVVSGWNPFSGDPREALTELLMDRYQADQVVLLGSGTQALTAAIQLARGDGDAPVALPAYTCYDVATAAVGANAPVILYDIDPDTLGPDWDSLEWALQNGARTIVVAYLYGIPIPWDRVQDLGDQHGAVVVEDAAQGIGGSWQGRPLGSLGSMSVLSFGRGKGWTGGRGGALLFRDGAPEPRDLSISRVTREALTGMVILAQWILGRPSLYGLPYRIPWLRLGETRYREPEGLGEMPRISAALVIASAEKTQREAGQRRRTATRLRDVLRDHPGLSFSMELEPGVPGYLRLPCRVRNVGKRDEILTALAATGAAPGYPTGLGRLPQIQNYLVPVGPTPGADTLAAELLTLPTHSLLGNSDLELLKTRLGARR